MITSLALANSILAKAKMEADDGLTGNDSRSGRQRFVIGVSAI